MYTIEFSLETCEKCQEEWARTDEEDVCPFCKLERAIQDNYKYGKIKY